MNIQRRRLDAETDSNTNIDQNTSDIVQITMDESEAVNVHGVRYCGSIEPEDGGANANGFWCLFCLPDQVISTTNDLPESFTALDNEDFLAYLWAVGCWTASNEAPYHWEVAPRTSRNCKRGARVVGYVIKSGISAGAVRINQTLTCFTSG